MGSNGLSRRSWERFSQPLPSLEARLAISVFLCLCLFVVTGLETLSHREHEARAHWHSFHFFHCFSLSLSFPDWFHVGGRVGPWWEGQQSSLNLTHDLTLSRGRLGKDPSAMAWNFWLSSTHVCLVFLGWKACSIRTIEKKTLWHWCHFCENLSLSLIHVIWVEGLALEGRSGKALHYGPEENSLGYSLSIGLSLLVLV